MATCPVQRWNEQKGGDPRTVFFEEGDDSDPGLASRRERGPTLVSARHSLLPAWVLHQGKWSQRPQCVKGKGPKDPGVEAPLNFAQTLGYGRVKARGVIGRIGGILRYASWLRAQGVGVCCVQPAMTVAKIDPRNRDLQVGDRADRCCTGVHHCVCRRSKLGACRPGPVYLLPAWFLR